MSEFRLMILAANRPFYDGPCESVTIPATDGDMQFLANHNKHIGAIVPGALRFRKPGGSNQTVAVGNGIVRVSGEDVLVLVDVALWPEEIDEVRAQERADAAMEAMRQDQSIREYRLAQGNLARTLSLLRVKKSVNL